MASKLNDYSQFLFFATPLFIYLVFILHALFLRTLIFLHIQVGREKNTVFCLIQKFVDLKVLGTKLQIISAFAVEHIKGFVFIEAEKQSDVAEVTLYKLQLFTKVLFSPYIAQLCILLSKKINL